MIAIGDHIVIANNGSIISVGDNTVVKANTGDAAASGVIALEVVDSVVTSGSSHGVSAGGSSGTTPGSPTGTQGGAPVATATTNTAAGSGPPTRAVAIAGYENKALEVVGNHNLLTNNDSNVFYHRAGDLNGNTGDTDMSGLNVVDATRSVVRSGSSASSAEPARSTPVVAVPTPAPGTASASVTSQNGTATASGADSLVIGGNGVVDASVTMHGDHNVATSDDGNVAVGGVGDVNAQVGDSDTSGAVVMDITDSQITTGNSASQTSPTPTSP